MCLLTALLHLIFVVDVVFAGGVAPPEYKLVLNVNECAAAGISDKTIHRERARPHMVKSKNNFYLRNFLLQCCISCPAVQ